MKKKLIEAMSSLTVTLALSSCASPTATLPMAGSFEWVNTNAPYSATLEEDQGVCSSEADLIDARLKKCASSPPQDCDRLTDTAAQALCQYSNATTKHTCSVGRVAIPKEEIVDGCIAARGWKQIWIKSGE
jgi:hypothetical protein